MNQGELFHEILALLGEDCFVALAEAFGGVRLNVPYKLPDDHAIVRAIGAQAAARLSRRFAPAVLRVPLARELRARHYRARGDSNATIARKLGMTEPGVERIFRTGTDTPAKGSVRPRDPNQFSLFE